MGSDQASINIRSAIRELDRLSEDANDTVAGDIAVCASDGLAALEVENAALREALLASIGCFEEIDCAADSRDVGEILALSATGREEARAALANEPSGKVPVDRERLRWLYDEILGGGDEPATDDPVVRAEAIDWLARLIGEEGEE